MDIQPSSDPSGREDRGTPGRPGGSGSDRAGGTSSRYGTAPFTPGVYLAFAVLPALALVGEVVLAVLHAVDGQWARVAADLVYVAASEAGCSWRCAVGSVAAGPLPVPVSDRWRRRDSNP